MGFFIRDMRRWDDGFRIRVLAFCIGFVGVCVAANYALAPAQISTVLCSGITGRITVGEGSRLQVTDSGYSAVVKGHRQYYMKDVNETCISMDKEDYAKASSRP